MGYHGQDSDFEHRIGKLVAVNKTYYKAKKEACDLAFIRIERSFNDVQPIPWAVCPAKGTDIPMTVVGYPADDYVRKKGEHMFHSNGKITYKIGKDENMLQHDLGTECGKRPHGGAYEAR